MEEKKTFQVGDYEFKGTSADFSLFQKVKQQYDELVSTSFHHFVDKVNCELVEEEEENKTIPLGLKKLTLNCLSKQSVEIQNTHVNDICFKDLSFLKQLPKKLQKEVKENTYSLTVSYFWRISAAQENILEEYWFWYELLRQKL